MLLSKKDIEYPLYLYKDDGNIYKYRVSKEKDEEDSSYLGEINKVSDMEELLSNESAGLKNALINKTFYIDTNFSDDYMWYLKEMEIKKEMGFLQEYEDVI